MEDLFVHYVETSDLYFKYAKGEPSLKGREFHDFHEFLLFLEGEAYFVSENIQQELPQGSIVLIPSERFHQFRIKDPLKYKRCVIGFYETPEISELIRRVMSDVKIICNPDKRINELYDNLINIVKSEIDDKTKKLYIKASVIQFLVYFDQMFTTQITYNINVSPVVQQAMIYIDKNYAEKLTVESIAKRLYTAPSTLAHKFSKELGITIYQYISKKRMLSVNRMVKEGESYAEAAVKSGFCDYSCYYRMYKKYYSAETNLQTDRGNKKERM